MQIGNCTHVLIIEFKTGEIAGGSVLFIETTTRRSNPVESDEKKASAGSLEITGHLGDVMKESTRIALTVARNYLAKHDPSNKFLDTAHLHLHVPQVCNFFLCSTFCVIQWNNHSFKGFIY